MPSGTSSTQRSHAAPVRIDPGCSRGFRLSAKSKTRLRLARNGRLVKNIDTGKIWATLRQPFSPDENDRLFAALRTLNSERRFLEQSGLVDAQLVVHRAHDGTHSIGLKFIDTAGGARTPRSAPQLDKNAVLGYLVRRDTPEGWSDIVRFAVHRALLAHGRPEVQQRNKMLVLQQLEQNVRIAGTSPPLS